MIGFINVHIRRTACLIFAFCVLPVSASSAAILDIQEVTSPLGLKAWLVEDHSVPVISVRFMFRGAGSINDPADKQGLSQILSNTLDEGAGKLDSPTFQAQLNDQSISLSFHSGRDDFGGSLKTLTKYQDQAFNLLSLALTEPRFDADPVRRMIESNLVRIRSNMTDPEWMAARLNNAVIFGDHPYAMNSGGTLSSLPKITPQDLRQKLKSQLAQDNLIISVAGDISKDQLAAMLDLVFGKLPQKAQVKAIEDKHIAPKEDVVLYRQDIPQTFINMTIEGIPHDDPDYHAAEVMDFVLGSSGFGSRLTDEVREKRGLTYGIYSSINGMKHANLYSIGTSTKNESTGEVINLTRQVMEGMTKSPISDKELLDAKTYLIGSIPLALTSTDRISGMMISLQSDDLPKDYLDLRAEKLGKITTADVLKVSQRLLTPSGIKITLVGNPKIGNNPKIISALPNVE